MKRFLLSLIACALLPVLAALVTGCATPKPPEVAAKVPGAMWDFKILKMGISTNQTEATVSFVPRFGIFAFELKPLPPTIQKLVLGIYRERDCEGLTFRASEDATQIDLLRVKGVNVLSVPDGLAIEVIPPALDLIRRGGQVMFVNQYR